MSINELKNLIHSLVDKSENKYLLELIHNLFSFSESKSGENHWEKLSDSQREMVLKAFEQSESESNLMSHNSVMSQIKNEL